MEEVELQLNGTTTISWNSTKEVAFFAVLEEGNWDGIYFYLSLRLDLSVINALWKGESVPQEVVDGFPSLLNETMSAIETNDYYAIGSQNGESTRNMEKGYYYVIVLSFGETGELEADVSQECTRVVTEIEIVEETRYRNATRTRTVTRYREAERWVTLWKFISG